jgi:N-acetylneuraminic acid mutarotase
MTTLQPKTSIICLIVVYTKQDSFCFRFAVGGYDGNNKISTVEIFDPRANSWRIGSSSSIARGYGCAVTVDDNLYLIGGVNDAGETIKTVSLLVVILP